MTLQVDPWAIQGESHSAEIARSAISGLLGVPVAAYTPAVSATTAGGGHGVVGSGDLAVTQNGTPNMSVNVAAGRAFIRGGVSSGAATVGTYAVMNDATTNVSIAAADATNPRIDLVCVQVRDTNYGEAASEARFFVVQGTPAAVPAVPSISGLNVLVLAQVAVGAAVTTIVTGNITDKRTFAASIGGIQRCTSTTRPTSSSLYEGLVIDETDLDRLWVYDGAAWRFVTNYGTAGRSGVILTDSTQTIATATATDITWGTEVSDVDGWTSGGSATLTVPSGWDGRYAISFYGKWATSVTGSTSCAIYINGTYEYVFEGNPGAYNAVAASAVRSLAATDTIKVNVTHNAGANRDINSRLEVIYLGR